MNTYKYLKNLVETPGPSGNEMLVADIIQGSWEPLVDQLTIDRIGNLIAIKEGSGVEPRPRVLLAAHMDEIGLMVNQILPFNDSEDAFGFLRVTRVGGVDLRHLYGQSVIVHGSNGHELIGVLGSLPAWKLPAEKRNKPFSLDDLVVDTGKPYKELKKLVSIGDFVSFRQPLRRLLNRRVTGKALDNRASVAAITICLEELSRRNQDWDVIAVATAQEETRLLGAYTSAFAINPELAIAIDVTFGRGPGANDELTYGLNEGPTISLGPNFHPGVYQSLKIAAKNLEMKIHTEPQARAGGTDANGLQIARAGIPTGLISIPLRYMHTMVETVALIDVERVGRLLAEFITRLDDTILSQIVDDMMDEKSEVLSSA